MCYLRVAHGAEKPTRAAAPLACLQRAQSLCELACGLAGELACRKTDERVVAAAHQASEREHLSELAAAPARVELSGSCWLSARLMGIYLGAPALAGQDGRPEPGASMGDDDEAAWVLRRACIGAQSALAIGRRAS